MTPRQGALYRLQLADLSLDSARDNLARGKWRDAALFARAAVENAAKAIESCFTSAHRTHEPGLSLAEALRSPNFPTQLRSRAQALLPRVAPLGMKEHVELAYGDEDKGITPWRLVTERRARDHVAVAEEIVALGHDCHTALFPS